MNELKNVVSEYLRDTLYEASVTMRSDREVNLTIITDNLRGVCGITIVSITEPAVPVSETAEKTSLNVKFFKVKPTMQEQVVAMSSDARRVTGVYSFVVRDIKKVVNRIYRG